MILKVSQIVPQIQALLDDPGGDWATVDYLIPFIQFAQDQMSVEAMQNPELGQLTGTVIIPAVAVGVTSLAAQFQAGGALELLTDVISMKERAAGGTRQEQDWIWMTRARDLPTMTPSSFNGYYGFTGDDIKLPGSDQTMDFRVFGKFAVRALVDGDSPLVPNTSPILVGRAAGIVAGSRGNDGMADRWERMGINAQSSFVCNAIMEMQNVRARMRSYSGRNDRR